MGFLRIIAGELGGRRISTPRGSRVRPTAERVREALFSILGGRLTGARVLDAFAGTGALGLEALSRGAREVVFVESSASVLTVLRGNVESLGVVGSCKIVRADAVASLASGVVRGPFEIILADPPYDSAQADRFLEAVDGQSCLTPEGLLVLERPASATALSGLSRLRHERSARYGDTRLEFYSS